MESIRLSKYEDKIKKSCFKTGFFFILINSTMKLWRKVGESGELRVESGDMTCSWGNTIIQLIRKGE